MTLSQPLFTVIIPTYNAVDKVAGSIDSVLSQKRDLVELIVMDGGSTDGTVDVLRGYGDALTFVSEPDQGIYDAMNKGIQRSRGTYVHFLGAGDKLRPGILETLAPQMPDVPNSFVYGNVWWCHEKIVHDGPFTPLKLIRGCITHQAIFHHRTLYDTFGLYELRYKTAADYAKNFAYFGSPKVNRVYIDCIVADYEGGGVSDNVKDWPFLEDRPRLIRERMGWGAWLAFQLEALMPKWLKDARMHAVGLVRRAVGGWRRPVAD